MPLTPMQYRRDHVRKVCACPRRKWGTCTHPWHFAYFYKQPYRFSLDKFLGRHLQTFDEARREANRIREAIWEGRFSGSHGPAPATPDPHATLSFRAFAEVWKARVGTTLASGKIHGYRLQTICAFQLPGTDPAITFGDKPLEEITTDDIEAFRDARKADGLSAVAVNHDLKLLRSMFNWAVRKGHTSRTPFKIGTVPALALEREIPRHKRFESADVEGKLLTAADPHLRAVITALLDTACRPGEILNLQWRDVSLERREFVVQAVKAKTRTMRLVPISTRLLGLLEIRRHDPAGEPLPSDAYVFGDALGRRAGSVRESWKAAAAAAGLDGFQLRDLRHESACRFEEAGTPVSDVSKLLGHTSLTTTSRYLMNMQRAALRRAVDRLERAAAAPPPQNSDVGDGESRHDAAAKPSPEQSH
jgi:integrase